MPKEQYILVVKWWADIAEKEPPWQLAEDVANPSEQIEIPSIPQSAKEQGIEKAEYITIEIYKKVA